MKLSPAINIKRGKFHGIHLVFFALMFLILGGYFFYTSHAATLTGDINGDNTVNITDLSLLLSSYGHNTTQCISNASFVCDINTAGSSAGVVDIFDLSALLTNYGSSGASVSCTATFNPTTNIASIDQALQPGATVCLTAGTYGSSTTIYQFTHGGSSSSRATLTSADGTNDVTLEGGYQIRASSTSTSLYLTVSHITFKLDYLEARSPTQSGCDGSLGANNAKNNAAKIFDIEASDVTLTRNEFSETSVPTNQRDVAVGVDFNGTAKNVVIDHNKIHDFGDCDQFDHGIYFDFVTSGGSIHDNWIWNGP
jgi:hypothetical protein